MSVPVVGQVTVEDGTQGVVGQSALPSQTKKLPQPPSRRVMAERRARAQRCAGFGRKAKR